jgi:preprotein translocase subunit SecG
VIYLLYTLHVLVCVFLILVVLLQQGKGADLSVFGGGSTQTAFGARGATTFLHKLTVASFIIFVLTTLAIGIPQLGGSASVMRGATGAGKGTKGTSGSRSAPGQRGGAPAPAGRPAPLGAPAQGAPGKAAAPIRSAPAPSPAAPAPAPKAPPAPGSGTPGTPR